MAQSGKWPLPADDVFVEILACAETEGEPAVGQQLHGRRFLRDDGGMVTADRAVTYVIRGMRWVAWAAAPSTPHAYGEWPWASSHGK